MRYCDGENGNGDNNEKCFHKHRKTNVKTKGMFFIKLLRWKKITVYTHVCA